MHANGWRLHALQDADGSSSEVGEDGHAVTDDDCGGGPQLARQLPVGLSLDDLFAELAALDAGEVNSKQTQEARRAYVGLLSLSRAEMPVTSPAWRGCLHSRAGMAL
jgi:hypothetical protein